MVLIKGINNTKATNINQLFCKNIKTMSSGSHLSTYIIINNNIEVIIQTEI